MKCIQTHSQDLEYKGITLADFHSDGTTSKRFALSKISVIDFTITGDAIRIILAGILSIPVDIPMV